MSNQPHTPATDDHELFKSLVRSCQNGHLLALYVRPRASRNGFAGVRQDPSSGRCALVVTVNAPPVDGAANQHIVRFIAKCLSISPSRVTLVSGDASRHKTLLLEQLPSETLRTWLASVLHDNM